MSLLVPGTEPRASVRRESGESASADELAVDVRQVCLRFGSSRALVDVSVEIPWEQRVALVGPNGAGKTSLFRILATLARPTSGHVLVGGLRLPEQAAAIRRHVGFVAHQTLLYDDLTVRENLQFYGKLYGVAGLPRRIDDVLGPLGLAHRADDRVRSLSRGLQQRAALARAILHDPPILLLDEPDAGLDVEGTDVLSETLQDSTGRRRTVLLTSHDLGRALELTDRVLVVVEGKIALDRASSAMSVSTLESIVRVGRGRR